MAAGSHATISKIKAILIWMVIFLPFASFGQSMAPLGALPMQYNSSFAGSNGGPRISSFAGYERSTLQYTLPTTIPNTIINRSNTAYSLYTAYDQFIPAIRSGIGLTASLSGHNYNYLSSNSTSNSSSSANEKPRYASFALAVAPKFSIKGKYTISPSLDLAYTNTWNQSYGVYIDSSWVPIDVIYHSLTSRAAILFNSNKYYLGYSVDLASRTFARNNIPTLSSNINKYFNSYLQMGYTFGRSTSKFSFIPQLVLQIHSYPYENRLRIGLQALNLNFRYNKVICGFNNGGVHVGWQNEQLRFMLTNSLSFINRDSNYNSFNGSLSLRYLIPSIMQKKYTLPGM
jgi:hypothetical protein